MKYLWACVLGLGFVFLVPPLPDARAEGWLDGLGRSLSEKAEKRIDSTSERIADKAFDTADEGVDCVVGDADCFATADDGARTPPPAAPASASTTARCVATDVSCLEQASAQGQRVEIVRGDPDVLRCSMYDTPCLERAKRLGKKVEITD